MNCTGHPEHEKLIQKAQLYQGSAQLYKATEMESSSLNHRMWLFLLLPHCLCHVPSSIGKKMGWGCVQRKSFMDCSVLTPRAWNSELTRVLVKDGEKFLIWSILRTHHYTDAQSCMSLQYSVTACMHFLRMLNLICFATENEYSHLAWNNDFSTLCNNPQNLDDRSTYCSANWIMWIREEGIPLHNICSYD